MGGRLLPKDFRNSKGEKVYPGAKISRGLHYSKYIIVALLGVTYIIRTLNYLFMQFLHWFSTWDHPVGNEISNIWFKYRHMYPSSFNKIVQKENLPQISKILWVTLAVVVILHFLSGVLRLLFQEKNPFKDDIEARRIRKIAIRELGIDYNPNERPDDTLWNGQNKHKKKRKTAGESDAHWNIRFMRVDVHTRLDTRSKKVQKEFVVRIKQPRNIKIRSRLENDIKGLSGALQRATHGEVGFGDMQVEASGNYYKFEGQKIVKRTSKAGALKKNKRIKKPELSWSKLPKINLKKINFKGLVNKKKVSGSVKNQNGGYTFPLDLFEDKREEISTQTELATEFSDESLKKIQQQLMTLNIPATLNEDPYIGNSRIRYVFDVPDKTNYNFGDLEKQFNNALKINNVDVVQGAGVLEITVPLPNGKPEGTPDLTIPIDIPTMIRTAFPDGKARDVTEMILGLMLDGNVAREALADAPHLLIGGATGKGKSVAVNQMIVTIMVHNTPDDVAIGLIDPKEVEFGMYEGNPFLLSDPVYDKKDALTLLEYLVIEMKRRYTLFRHVKSVRNVNGYNKWAEKNGKEKLKKIIIIVDEMAELMAESAGEVDEVIQRLGQAARAAGIHIILATQSPRVSVVSGIIKANMPSRISMGVSSWTESNIILDEGGAEKLTSPGEMLIKYNGYESMVQCKGGFISDEELENILKYLESNVEAAEHVDYKGIVGKHKEQEESEEDDGEFGMGGYFSRNETVSGTLPEFEGQKDGFSTGVRAEMHRAFQNKRQVNAAQTGEVLPNLDRLSEEKLEIVRQKLKEYRDMEEDLEEPKESNYQESEEEKESLGNLAMQRMFRR